MTPEELKTVENQWQPMETAPKNETWVELQLERDGEIDVLEARWRDYSDKGYRLEGWVPREKEIIREYRLHKIIRWRPITKS